MSRTVKISTKDKLAAIKEYQHGNKTLREIAGRLGVHHSSVEKWITLYKTFGEEGLQCSIHNRKYPESLKQEAVRYYLKSGKTMHDVSRKYGLRSLSQLQYWIKKYEREELKSSASKI